MVFMTKHKTTLLVIASLMLGTMAAFAPLMLSTTHGNAAEYSGVDAGTLTPVISATMSPLLAVNCAAVPAPEPMTVAPAVASVATTTAASSAVLNARQRFALGMIETANNDEEIGGAGEVSRYQIMPSVWKHYSDSRRYQDPEVSLEV